MLRMLFALSVAGAMALAAAPASARQVVGFDKDVPPGSIVVKTGERRLYLSLGDGRAVAYRVAVGRQEHQWFGRSSVADKQVQPAWSPPDVVRRNNPRLPDVIPGGAPGNPLGAAALILAGGQYGIHGTNKPSSIGTFASYGCIRMHNDDILDLYGRVGIGTSVYVIP